MLPGIARITIPHGLSRIMFDCCSLSLVVARHHAVKARVAARFKLHILRERKEHGARLCSVHARYEAHLRHLVDKAGSPAVADGERSLQIRGRNRSVVHGDLERLPELRAQAESCNCPELTSLAGQIDLLDDVKTAILAAIDPEAPSTLKDGGVIAKGYHAEVDAPDISPPPNEAAPFLPAATRSDSRSISEMKSPS